MILRSFAALAAASAVVMAAEPAEELAAFQVHPDFEVNLFASEADGVVKPIQMRFDARGRLWVIGSTVYPQPTPGQEVNDKVLILEDNDQDGRADKTKIFADGLMIPTGLELTRDGAYIGHGTELLHLRDLDQDDRAELRAVVLRGFGTGDNHQNINSFNWGPSGELWMCQGLHIHSNVETPHGIVRMNQAGIWRFFPLRLKLEGYFGSHHEPQNPWGHVFNEWNEHFVLAGNNSSPIFPDVGLIPNRRDDPPPQLWPSGNGRKVSGGDFVANAHFPREWQGRLILGGYINNAVWSVDVVEDGAGFRFEDAPPLIRSTGREFRPVDIRFGPDGALYICDWYNPIIGHYQASFRDPGRDKTHGRIWRVTAKSRPLAPRPAIFGAGAEELLKHLGSENRWARYQAKRQLAYWPEATVHLIAEGIADDPNAPERALMDAAGILQSHEAQWPDLVRRLAKARDPRARAYAAHLVGIHSKERERFVPMLYELASDNHPRVRLQAIIAAAQADRPESIHFVLRAADHPFDRFLSYAFNQAVHSLKRHWLPLLQAGTLTDQPNRLAALVRADATADTLQALRGFLKAPRPGFLQILAETGEPDDLAALLRLNPAQLDGKILGALAERPIQPSGNLAELLQPLLSAAVKSNAMILAGQWKVQPLLSRLRESAVDERAPVSERRAALFALGRSASEPELLRRLAKSAPIEIRSAAIIALHPHDPASAASAAADLMGNKTAAEAAAEIVNSFLQRPRSADALASALNGERVDPEVSRKALATLSASGRRHEGLFKALDGDQASLTVADWPGFVKDAQTHGDSKRGKTIYERPELGCVSCHKVNDLGGAIGPNLSALGTAQPVEFIARAILDPQKEIKEGFNSVSITTKSGDEFQGYIQRESRDEVVLRDPLLNQEVRVRRGEIGTMRPNGSLMPAGLVASLSTEEFRDLVAYLATLGKP